MKLVELFLLEKTLQDVLNSITEVEVDGKMQNPKEHDDMMVMAGKLDPFHILAYVTGSRAVPAGGWPSRPRIEFDHNQLKEERGSYPRTSTCALRLTIPITPTNQNLEGFVFVMAYSMAHGGTFSDI